MVDTNKRIGYIKGFVLPEVRHEPSPPGVGGGWAAGDSAQINAGALLAFDKGLSRQQEADASNSLLFAQLAADAQADRFTAEPIWSKTYRSVLETVGWNIRKLGSLSPARITPPVEWAEVVAKAYSGLSTAAMAVKAMNAAAMLPAGSRALVIWVNNAAGAARGNFIVQTCRMSNGDLLGDSAQVIYTLIQEPDGFLSWTSSYEVATRSTEMTLNEDVYKVVRELILDRLGDRQDYFVAPVPL